MLELKFEDYIKNIKYITPNDFLPKIGFQNLDSQETYKKIADPQGFCAIWTIWYVDIRLTYPDIDRDKLVSNIIMNIKKQIFF